MNTDRFKFRVWDESLKEMITDNECDLSTYDGELQACYTAGHSHPSYKSGEIVPCVLMQSTGLKDKNGALIFEGDILINTHGGIFVVKLITDDHYCGWRRINKNGSKLDIGADNFLQICGNRFENPELLEQ